VATATSFLGVVFIWVLGVWGIIVLVWSKKSVWGQLPRVLKNAANNSRKM
jgi:hypothetical protein